MVKWFFKRFLCHRDIHKIVSVPVQVLPFAGFMMDGDKPKRYCFVPACKYCGREYIAGTLPKYEDATHEEVIIHGRNPFEIYIFPPSING